MKYAVSNGQRLEARPSAVGTCPCCGADMITKCGDLKVWHWAHKSKRVCDHWWESETEWHRAWKDTFSKEWQEVVALATKMAKPEKKTVTRTVAVPKTKIVKQEPQQQTTPKDTERTDFTPIRPQPPLSNQKDDKEKR